MKITKFDKTETIIFVSGMFAGSWIWEDTLQHMERSRMWMIDDPLCALGSDVDSISERISEEIKNLQRPVTLVGNSLGSIVSLKVAAAAPKLVKKVFISGSAGFGKISLDVKLLRHNPGKTAEDLVHLILHDQSMVSPTVCDKTAESFAMNFKSIVKLIKESHSLNAREILSQVSCPVHAIWGSHDKITPFEETVETFEEFGVPSSIIDKCGHSPMFERPNEFASVLNQHIH